MKLDRLLAMTMLLLNRRRVGAKELAERFEVSLRTIYRDMETLSQSGIPIISYAGLDGGYEIMEHYRLERQFLSLEELQALVVALRGVRPVLDDKEIGGLLDKVGAMLAVRDQERLADGARQLTIDINPWNGAELDKEKLNGLRRAIREQRIIQFAYTSGGGDQSVRKCEPVRLVLKGFIWYVYGYCLMRQDFRVFRLSRIRELILTDTRFELREEAGETTVLQWGMGSGNQAEARQWEEIVLRFTLRGRARAEDYFSLWDNPIAKEERPDGSLIVTTRQPDEPWLYDWLLGFGTDVFVQSPASIATALRARAEQVVRLYMNH